MGQCKKPCKSCPFRKGVTDLGGSEVEVYVGQVTLPFWLPCHSDKNYNASVEQYGKVSQCAGAAIFRSNIGVADYMPDGLLKLPEDEEEVYTSLGNFYFSHRGIFLNQTTIDICRQAEIAKLDQNNLIEY